MKIVTSAIYESCIHIFGHIFRGGKCSKQYLLVWIETLSLKCSTKTDKLASVVFFFHYSVSSVLCNLQSWLKNRCEFPCLSMVPSHADKPETVRVFTSLSIQSSLLLLTFLFIFFLECNHPLAYVVVQLSKESYCILCYILTPACLEMCY